MKIEFPIEEMKKTVEELKKNFTFIDEESLHDVVWEWNKYICHQQSTQDDIDDEINRVGSINRDLDKGINALIRLKSTIQNKIYPFIGKKDNLEIDIQSLKDYLNNSQKKFELLRHVKKHIHNSDSLKLGAIIRVFSTGEHLGLTYEGRKGRKDPLLHFVKIVTGIKGRNTILDYYKEYKKLTSIPV